MIYYSCAPEIPYITFFNIKTYYISTIKTSSFAELIRLHIHIAELNVSCVYFDVSSSLLRERGKR